MQQVSPTPLQRFVAPILRLFGFGYGRVRFELNAAGELVEGPTMISVRMLPRETLEHFHQRLRRDYGMQAGDTIDIICNGNRFDVAHITLHPPR